MPQPGDAGGRDPQTRSATPASRFHVRLASWSADRAALEQVRRAVFVIEQRIPEALEWDADDAASLHALAVDANGGPVGCARLLADGHIGRVAVLSGWRGQGVGSALLMRLVAAARERGDAQVLLNAQEQAMPFYVRHGFRPHGAVFEEAGIAHQAMVRDLR